MILFYFCKFYLYKFGNYFGNFNFVWKILIDENFVEGDLEVVGFIRNGLFVFLIRVMRKEFDNRYLKCGMKFVVFRDVRRFLI